MKSQSCDSISSSSIRVIYEGFSVWLSFKIHINPSILPNTAHDSKRVTRKVLHDLIENGGVF
jgi:hypothetical protein